MLLSSFLKMPTAPVSSHQSLIPCFSVAARKRTCQLLHLTLAQGRAGPRFSVQHLALICYQNAKPVSNSYTKNMRHSGFQACQRDASGSNCAGVSCENQQKDQAALVTTGRIVPRRDEEILPQKANLLLTEEEWATQTIFTSQHVTNGAFQLPAGCLKWLSVERQWHFSDTGGILAQRHVVLNYTNYSKCCSLFRRRTSKPLLLQSTWWGVLFQVCKANVTCFSGGKSMLLSSFLKMPIAPVSSHQSLIPCFPVAARKRTCQLWRPCRSSFQCKNFGPSGCQIWVAFLKSLPISRLKTSQNKCNHVL